MRDTKEKFAEALKELMKHKPLEKISVKDIVEHSDSTRQTFYRHFMDKYDLVNWVFEQLADKSFRQMGISYTLKEGLMKKFNFILEERTFFSQAFACDCQNSIKTYDYECIYQFYRNIIIQKTHEELSPDIEFLLSMYCRGSIDKTVEWATGGMERSPDEITDLLIEALPDRLKELLSDLQQRPLRKNTQDVTL